MPTGEKFNELYKKLNSEQRDAVDTIEGPVMVVAGPGTGKTQILTLRIANILRKTDVPPDAILALTFTEAAAFNMRKRLVEIIGTSAYRVGIFTFHSFANSIIQSYPDRFPNIIGASNINIVDQIKILQKIIDETKLKLLKPFGNTYYYLRPMLSLIGKLKKENISVTLFKKLVAKEKNREKFEEALLLYKLYQEHLRKNYLYDYDDMIMEVISVLESDKSLLLELQEEYQYILADEHQDANRAQNRLLELLASYYENPNLFIVGDEKQAIFRFQGASLDNFNHFKKRFSGTKVITLSTNYRSEQFILNSASSLIPQGKLLAAKKGGGGKINVSLYEKVEDEAHHVRKKIEVLIKRAVPPGEIAVIYRDNKDALPIIAALEKSRVPFVIESDQDILADRDISKLILLMRAVEKPADPELFARAVHIDFLGIENLEIYQYLRKEGKSKAVVHFERQIADWRKTSRNTDLVHFFEIIVRESGFLKHILLGEDSVEKMEKLDTLFDEIKSLIENHRSYALADFLSYIDLIEEHNILLKKEKAKTGFDAVRLMTAHKSKGQEFDHVFIIGASAGHWGNRKTQEHFKLIGDPAVSSVIGSPDDSDERRLFYVAITRARRGVHISYHSRGRDGQNLLPSQFIHEIDPALIAQKREGASRSEGFEVKKESYKKARREGPSFADKKYLRKLFDEREFSVTALNNYLRCPWQYFYSNLVRIPTAISKHQMYGIAIHAALKDLFGAQKRTKKRLLEGFKRALRRQAFSEKDFDAMLEKGTKALSGYFDTYHKTWSDNVRTEMQIKGVVLGDIALVGKLDRVEMLSGGQVRVVDYKTSRPKSRNEIIGLSGDKTGDMKRQIVFYKLLLDNFERGKYRMAEGEIDFVEPNDRGKYKKEVFKIEENDTEELKKVIEKTIREIRSLSFWNRTCGDPKCQWCALRSLSGLVAK